LETDAAAAAASAIDSTPSGWTAHKMDSTLRGNWAAEVRSRQAVRGSRVVVLPAWPALGRTCVDGVVRVHGDPIGSVLDHLPEATLARTADDLLVWLDGDGATVVCDIADDATMDAMASLVAGLNGLLVVGPAGPLGAVFAARFGHSAHAAAPPIEGPVLVVRGSANRVSVEQVDRLVAAGLDVTVVAAAAAEGPLHHGVAADLAMDARDAATRISPATIVLLGGDTAAAYLGNAPRLVGGTVATGMPWSRDVDGGGPLVITKAGGFGGPDALVSLLSPRGV
jgi:4-hydroxythreonine-4-phosphate dehydrogenase